MKNNYSETFNLAFDHTLKNEGGYVNDKNDSGGETRYGISKRSYPNLDIKNLTIETAKEIYHRDFWINPRISKLPAKIAMKVFDTGVNIGTVRAIRMLQDSLIALGATVSNDGIIGTKTIGAIDNYDHDKVLAEYRKLQEKYYRDLVAKNPKNSKFLNGWIRRAKM